MKHFPILFALLMVICIGFIVGFFIQIGTDRVVEKPKYVSYATSKLSTIETPDIPDSDLEGEGDTYNPSQIYFMDIEPLYDIFSFDDMEFIKAYITRYMHANVNPSVLDIMIKADSIESSASWTNFDIELVSGEIFKISVNSGELTEITVSRYMKTK